MDNFFSNDEIVYLFESNAFAMFTMERLIKQQEDKLKELDNLTGNNPIAKAIANIIGSASKDSTAEDLLKALRDGTSEGGKRYKLMQSIVSSLNLPYYAITGRTLEEYRKYYNEHGPKTNVGFDDLIRSFL